MSPEALDLVEAHVGTDDVAQGLDPIALEPLELPLAVVRLLGALAGSVLADIGLELSRLLFLSLGLALQHLGLLGPEPPVLAVVARVGGDPPLVQLPDPGDDLVEEVAVVAHDHHRDRLARQVALEPLGRGDVEVVRRLVEEHHVGALQEQPGQHHPRLLAAGERQRVAVELRLGEAQAREDLLDPVVDRIGVLVLDLLVERVVAERGPLAVGLIVRLGHLLGGLFQLVLELDQRRQARLDDVDHRLARREVGLLPQQADADARPAVEIAVIGPVVAGQELHQRRLAGAVGSDQPDALARPDLERQVLKHRIAAELPAESLCRDEDHGSRVVPRAVHSNEARSGGALPCRARRRHGLDASLQSLPERLPHAKLVWLRLIDVGCPLNFPIVRQSVRIALNQQVRQVVNMVGFDCAPLGISRPCQRSNPQKAGGQDLLENILDLGRIAHCAHRKGRSRTESPRATAGKSRTRTSTDRPASAAARTAWCPSMMTPSFETTIGVKRCRPERSRWR